MPACTPLELGYHLDLESRRDGCCVNERNYPGVTSCKVVCMGAAGLGYVLMLILNWSHHLHVVVGEQWGGAGFERCVSVFDCLSDWKVLLAYRGQRC